MNENITLLCPLLQGATLLKCLWIDVKDCTGKWPRWQSSDRHSASWMWAPASRLWRCFMSLLTASVRGSTGWSKSVPEGGDLTRRWPLSVCNWERKSPQCGLKCMWSAGWAKRKQGAWKLSSSQQCCPEAPTADRWAVTERLSLSA